MQSKIYLSPEDSVEVNILIDRGLGEQIFYEEKKSTW
jgi:hypothetical protein